MVKSVKYIVWRLYKNDDQIIYDSGSLPHARKMARAARDKYQQVIWISKVTTRPFQKYAPTTRKSALKPGWKGRL